MTQKSMRKLSKPTVLPVDSLTAFSNLYTIKSYVKNPFLCWPSLEDFSRAEDALSPRKPTTLKKNINSLMSKIHLKMNIKAAYCQVSDTGQFQKQFIIYTEVLLRYLQPWSKWEVDHFPFDWEIWLKIDHQIHWIAKFIHKINSWCMLSSESGVS